MAYTLPEYRAPDFKDKRYKGSPDVTLKKAPADGVPPSGFYLSTVVPTYYKYQGEWVLPEISVPFCSVVLRDRAFEFVECADVRAGDEVVTARAEDGSEGVFVHFDAFSEERDARRTLHFEVSGSEKYETLSEIMRYQKKSGGHIVWVLGPAVVFNYDTRIALEALARTGYVQAVLAGNALATHDLEGGYLNTALGQDIYTQEAMPNGHYNHLDAINACRSYGSIESFIGSGKVMDGFMKTLVEEDIPYVLAGSIRDDGPLPPVHASMRASVDAMTAELKKATLVINLATLLHGVAASAMVPGYRVIDGRVQPLFVYTVDITSYAEDSVAKVRRDFLSRAFVTNVQDFVFTLKKLLVGSKKESRR